jgi:hypothetical protein
LAGINNQNFIMRDEETGTYWQQVSGRAISGPLQGAQLELVRNDEMTFALWKAESPEGSILAPGDNPQRYEKEDWEQEMGRYPTVVTIRDSPLPLREIILGVSHRGEDRAYPYARVLEQKVVQDLVGGDPVVLLAGPDGKAVRAFLARSPEGKPLEFFRQSGEGWSLFDSAGHSAWDFRGCAVSGPARGECLTPIVLLKDYWFDWHQYHPRTTVYSR